MVTGYVFTAFLIILGLAVMRFGSIYFKKFKEGKTKIKSKLSGQLSCLLYTSPSPRDPKTSRMPSSA